MSNSPGCYTVLRRKQTPILWQHGPNVQLPELFEVPYLRAFLELLLKVLNPQDQEEDLLLKLKHVFREPKLGHLLVGELLAPMAVSGGARLPGAEAQRRIGQGPVLVNLNQGMATGARGGLRDLHRK